MPQNGLDARHILAHLREPLGIFQLARGVLEPQIKELRGEILFLLAKLGFAHFFKLLRFH